MELSQHHDMTLVLLAVGICAFSAFSALNIASRAQDASTGEAAGWTLFAAFALGGGIWSMHFIAMLGMELPVVTVLFDTPKTIGSMGLAVVFTWAGLAIVRSLGSSFIMLLAGGLCMGLGIAGMHYMGMAAMRMPVEIVYDPVLFVASFAIAILASMAALWLCFNLESLSWRLGSACLMTFAAVGMHYCGMAAATFRLRADALVHTDSVVNSGVLAAAVALGAVLLFGVGLATALIDRRVTENLRAGTERIRRSEERFRLMVNGLQDYAIIMLDPAGRVSSWNDGAARLDGFSAEEVLGRSCALFDADAENAPRILARALSEASLRGRFEAEMKRRRKDGSTYWASVTFHPVYDGAGELSGFASVTHDVTERRQAEKALRSAYDGLEAKVAERTQELKEAMEAAEAANSAKSSFLANMSHELRTPLNAIIGYTEMLIEDFEDQGDAGTVDDLHRIEKSGRHLLTLINEVLDLAKVEAGRVSLDLEAVDVAALVDEAMSTVRPIAERFGNNLLLDLQVPGLHIESDRKRLFQCLLNLLSNASKFTENGDVELIVGRTEIKDRDAVSFVVRDSGIGMSEEQLDKVFEPFEQADGTLTREREGTGLGLTITRRLVQMMGGDITVTSKPGIGSTFTLVAPVSLEEMHDDGRSATLLSGMASPVLPEAMDAVGPLALIIDDDLDALDIYRRVLERSGFRTRVAQDGESGLAEVRTTVPDLILLDIAMPEMDGWQVLGALKEDPRLANIPVVIVSVTDEAAQGLALGAVDWLTKPVSAEALTSAAARISRVHAEPRVLVFSDQIDVIEPVGDTLDDLGISCLFFESPDNLPDLQTFGPDILMIDISSRFGRPEVLERLKSQSNWMEMKVVLLASPSEDGGSGPEPRIDPALPPDDLLREVSKFVRPQRSDDAAAA